MKDWWISVKTGDGLKEVLESVEYVSDSYAMLARAYAYREQRGRAFVIYDDETPVGMGMYPARPDLDAFDLSQIFIDEQYQGEGYGKAATKLVLDEMKKDGKYRKVVLCYIEDTMPPRSSMRASDS